MTSMISLSEMATAMMMMMMTLSRKIRVRFVHDDEFCIVEYPVVVGVGAAPAPAPAVVVAAVASPAAVVSFSVSALISTTTIVTMPITTASLHDHDRVGGPTTVVTTWLVWYIYVFILEYLFWFVTTFRLQYRSKQERKHKRNGLPVEQPMSFSSLSQSIFPNSPSQTYCELPEIIWTDGKETSFTCHLFFEFGSSPLAFFKQLES